MSPAYKYIKATSKNPHPGRFMPTHLKLVPTLFAGIGLALLATSVYPIVGYQLKQYFVTDSEDAVGGLLSPISYSEDVVGDGPVILDSQDYTKASTWFPGTSRDVFDIGNPPGSTSYDSYLLSIPSLGISNANVSLTNEDLTQTLVHYPQTALPGQYGSPVIFGHSTLPQFYDQQNYKTIFSTLPKIKKDSDITINTSGIEYRYRVNKVYEVKPTDLWVLGQDYSRKTLKVVTCVPPGTTIRRLVVEADLVQGQ
jgi:sortase A